MRAEDLAHWQDWEHNWKNAKRQRQYQGDEHLRINNNASAMFMYRQYNIWNARMAMAVRRLSSGQRINSAVDDPAGLATSERMRAQIRGLNMAVRNCENACRIFSTGILRFIRRNKSFLFIGI